MDRNIFRMREIQKRTLKLSGKTFETCALKGELKWLRTLEYDMFTLLINISVKTTI